MLRVTDQITTAAPGALLLVILLHREIMAVVATRAEGLFVIAAHATLTFTLAAAAQGGPVQYVLYGPEILAHSHQPTQDHFNHDVHYSYRRWQAF